MKADVDKAQEFAVGPGRNAAKERMLSLWQARAAERRAGFTLPDLLVIIGVVALLGLLWLPAQASMGRKAGLLECKNNLRQVGWAIDMYTRDNQDYLPGPIWSGVFYNYTIVNSGSMAYYLRSYFGMPPPATYQQEVEVLKCPASVEAQPGMPPIPPLSVPICFLSCVLVTNNPGPMPDDVVSYPFGRPSNPYSPPVKTGRIRRPSEQWAMVDADRQNVPSGATYWNYLPPWPVHNNRPGGLTAPVLRNALYFDGTVRGITSAN